MGESIKKGLGKVTPMGVLENGELAHIRYLQIWSEGMGLRDATFPLEATHLLEANGNLFPSSPKSEEGETRDVYGWYS